MVPTVLTFADGESRQTVNVTILNDDLFEAPDETFKLVLQAASNGAKVSSPSAMAMVTIADDGDKAVILSRASVVANEGGAVDAYEIRLNARPTHAVTIHINGPSIRAGGELALTNPSSSGAVDTVERTLNGDQYSYVVFEPDKYNISQQVVVGAVDDEMSEVQEWHAIIHSSTSQDKVGN
jgi:hypothetical protein